MFPFKFAIRHFLRCIPNAGYGECFRMIDLTWSFRHPSIYLLYRIVPRMVHHVPWSEEIIEPQIMIFELMNSIDWNKSRSGIWNHILNILIPVLWLIWAVRLVGRGGSDNKRWETTTGVASRQYWTLYSIIWNRRTAVITEPVRTFSFLKYFTTNRIHLSSKWSDSHCLMLFHFMRRTHFGDYVVYSREIANCDRRHCRTCW